MRGTASLIKIGALFCAAILAAVPNSKSAFAQNRTAGNFGRPGIAQNRNFGNFGRFNDSFRGWNRFGFDRGRRDFGPNIVVVPSAVAPPYYGGGGSPLGYDSLSCTLHRPVQTPYGEVLEPVYVC
jgi:hypothetical protein